MKHLFSTLTPFLQRATLALRKSIMQTEPKLLDVTLLQSWQVEHLAALVTALGGDRKKLYLAWLATVTQEAFDDYQITKPEPSAFGSGRGPGPRLVVKSTAELFSIARKAAKQGRQPDECYPNFSRDVARRLTADERTEIVAIGNAQRHRVEGRAVQMQTAEFIRNAKEESRRFDRDAEKAAKGDS